jgi:hypothetical protein
VRELNIIRVAMAALFYLTDEAVYLNKNLIYCDKMFKMYKAFFIGCKGKE